jgi:hypothetical protein
MKAGDSGRGAAALLVFPPAAARAGFVPADLGAPTWPGDLQERKVNRSPEMRVFGDGFWEHVANRVGHCLQRSLLVPSFRVKGFRQFFRGEEGQRQQGRAELLIELLRDVRIPQFLEPLMAAQKTPRPLRDRCAVL